MTADGLALGRRDRERIARRALERIETHPSTHDQAYWYSKPLPGWPGPISVPHILYGRSPTDAAEMESCGATACLAGHIVFAAHELGLLSEHADTFLRTARHLMGLSRSPWIFSASRTRGEVLAWLRTQAKATA